MKEPIGPFVSDVQRLLSYRRPGRHPTLCAEQMDECSSSTRHERDSYQEKDEEDTSFGLSTCWNTAWTLFT